jgi:branched-chain amino acid transport system permease protein
VELHRLDRKDKGEPCCCFPVSFSSQGDIRLRVVLGYVKYIMKRFRILILIAIVFCLLTLPLLIGDSTTVSLAIDVLLLTAAAVSWNIFSGYTGYISLGNATYYGIGAYVLALGVQGWHISGGFVPFLLLPLAGMIAGAFSVPLGWIALRTRRFTFIVITIAIFFIFQSLAYNLQGLTGGSEGIFLPIPDWSADLVNLLFYLVAGTFVLLVTLVSWWIRHSKYGLVLLAIRDDEDRVLGLGIPTGSYKLGAYVLSATFTGIVGAIAIYFVGFINPSTAFDQGFDLTIVTISYLGGLGTVIGPIVGGLLLVPIQTILVQQYGVASTGFDQVLLGGILLVVLLLLPEGIVPSLQKRWRMWQNSRLKLQTQVVGTQIPSFSAISTHVSEPFGFAGEKSMKDHIVSVEQSSNVVWGIPHIPSRQTVILQPSMAVSQKMKAQRLVPLSLSESMTKQEPIAFDPIISWRCPFCRRPFLLRGNICYCPRCTYTRPLTDGIQPMLPSNPST